MRRPILVLLCAVELLVFTGRGGLRARYREVEQLLVIQTMGLDDYRGGVTLSLAAGAILPSLGSFIQSERSSISTGSSV